MLRWVMVAMGVAVLGCAAFEDKSTETGGGTAFIPEDTAMDRCTPYCQRMVANCGPNQTAIYPSGDDCFAACVEFDLSGTAGDETGNTLQCRETFAELTPTDHETYCPLAGPDSEACVD